MNQTAYNGVDNFIKGLPLIGGFCHFWFIPMEEVAAMPAINPANQVLKTDVVLKAGKSWRGPVPVPDRQLGFTEVRKTSKSGPYHEIKVGCTYPGDIAAMRNDFDNMGYHKYLIVGKLRATATYVLIGNTESGLDFTGDFDSGSAGGNAALNKLEFSTEQINKALVLPSFNGFQSGFVNFSAHPADADDDGCGVIRFQIGDGGSLTPAADTYIYTNPLLVGKSEAEFAVFRSGTAIYPGDDYTFDPATGKLTFTAAFGATDTILIKFICAGSGAGSFLIRFKIGDGGVATPAATENTFSSSFLLGKSLTDFAVWRSGTAIYPGDEYTFDPATGKLTFTGIFWTNETFLIL